MRTVPRATSCHAVSTIRTPRKPSRPMSGPAEGWRGVKRDCQTHHERGALGGDMRRSVNPDAKGEACGSTRSPMIVTIRNASHQGTARGVSVLATHRRGDAAQPMTRLSTGWDGVRGLPTRPRSQQ